MLDIVGYGRPDIVGIDRSLLSRYSGGASAAMARPRATGALMNRYWGGGSAPSRVSLGADRMNAALAALQADNAALEEALAQAQGAAYAQCPPSGAQEAMVVNRPLDNVNRFPLGFGQTVVAAGGSATIRQQPQQLFRGKRLVIPSNIAPSFLVTDIRVGNRSQLPVAAGIPALAFSENGDNLAVNLDTCQTSMFIDLDVTNIGLVNQTFTAALFGTQVS